jgi:N-acetyl-gamma-glutamyl-phosphate reductase common form
VKVAVVGAAGYVGGELLRLVLQHPNITEVVATSRSQAGRPVAEVHPALSSLTEARFAGLTAGEAARGQDVVFLSLEHGESSKVAGEVFDAAPGLVVDLAADFRVRDLRLYEHYYGAHAAPEFVPNFEYALADVRGSDLRGARALAAPGCFATAAQLALFPLRSAGVVGIPALFGVTGSSGAGVHPRPTTHHPARANNLFAYSVLQHRHDAEVLQGWRGWTGSPAATARLMTHSGPFVRGIHLTLHATVPADVAARVSAHFAEAYAGRPFVRITAAPPELTHAVGTNTALVHAAGDAETGEVQVMIVLDNLIKGAGGQAVQAMNLALGLDEASGLRLAAPFPC